MAYYTMRENDGSEWGYNPVTDKAEYSRREDRERSYGDYSGYGSSQAYSTLKSTLSRYSSISPEDAYEIDFYREVNKIKDSNKRQELTNEYENKRLRYNRENEQRQQKYREKTSEEKEEAINKYKREWKKRNALWRLFHQKYNPKKQDFGYKSSSVIENEIRNNLRR